MESINKQLNIREDGRLNVYQNSLAAFDPEDFLGFGGLIVGYPACVKAQCKECKNECKNTKGLRWLKGGKDCYNECRNKLRGEQNDRIDDYRGVGKPDEAQKSNNDTQEPGVSKNTIVALAVGGVLLIGVTMFFALRK